MDINTISTPTSYNKPGIPPPPAGWGRILPPSEAQSEMDESESGSDSDEGMS